MPVHSRYLLPFRRDAPVQAGIHVMARLTTKLLLCTTLVAPSVAAAQDLGGAVIELEEIVVFGGLLPTNLDTTGATIDVAESDDILRAGLGATAALDALPGVAVSAN